MLETDELIAVVRQPALAPDRVPRAVRERVLARARVARLPGLATHEVQDEDVLDAERLPELLLAALEDVVGVRERQEALLGAEELLEEALVGAGRGVAGRGNRSASGARGAWRISALGATDHARVDDRANSDCRSGAAAPA